MGDPPLTLPPPPPPLPPDRVLAGRQSVVTLQLAQPKLMLPPLSTEAVPEKTPAELTVTPEKLIHPVCSPQTYAERAPSALLSTPLCVGSSFIQPKFCDQA